MSRRFHSIPPNERRLAGIIWRLMQEQPANASQFPDLQRVYDDAERALIDLDLVDAAKRSAQIQEAGVV